MKGCAAALPGRERGERWGLAQCMRWPLQTRPPATPAPRRRCRSPLGPAPRLWIRHLGQLGQRRLQLHPAGAPGARDPVGGRGRRRDQHERDQGKRTTRPARARARGAVPAPNAVDQAACLSSPELACRNAAVDGRSRTLAVRRCGAEAYQPGAGAASKQLSCSEHGRLVTALHAPPSRCAANRPRRRVKGMGHRQEEVKASSGRHALAGLGAARTLQTCGCCRPLARARPISQPSRQPCITIRFFDIS